MSLRTDNLKNDEAIVKKNGITDFKLVMKILIGYGNLLAVTNYIIGSKGKRVALFKGNALILKGLYSVFRTFGIKHYGYRQAELFSYTLYELYLLAMLLVSSVREIKSGNIHTCLTHFNEGVFIFTGRSYCTNYFSFSHIYRLFRIFDNNCLHKREF